MEQNRKKYINAHGFTLIELLIAMTISAFVMAGIYTIFKNQQNSYLVQDEVTAMQQNVRAGVYYMVSEIRMAGYNPGGVVPPPRITAATNNTIAFERDDGTDTDTIVVRGYSYDANNRTLDDAGGQAVSEEIEAIGFAYAYDADDDGRTDTYNADMDGDGIAETPSIIWAVPNGGNWFNLDADNDGAIDDNDSPNPGVEVNQNLVGVDTGDSVDLNQIRAVRVSLLARTGRGDEEFSNNFIYIVGNQKVSPRTDGDTTNDSCRMRILTTIANCRNMGL